MARWISCSFVRFFRPASMCVRLTWKPVFVGLSSKASLDEKVSNESISIRSGSNSIKG